MILAKNVDTKCTLQRVAVGLPEAGIARSWAIVHVEGLVNTAVLLHLDILVEGDMVILAASDNAVADDTYEQHTTDGSTHNDDDGRLVVVRWCKWRRRCSIHGGGEGGVANGSLLRGRWDAVEATFQSIGISTDEAPPEYGRVGVR